MNKILNTSGVTRVCIYLGFIVIKVPRINYGHLNFLKGCLSNWKERWWYKNFNDLPSGKLVIPSFWCSWFGLIQIQARAEKIRKAPLRKKEKEIFKDICTDLKSQNFGYYKGRLVCLDYAD